MANYNAAFQGGTIDGTTGAIYTTDTINNKSLTITFTSVCPGGGLDGTSATSVRFSGSCVTTLQNAVRRNRRVNLYGTKTGASLTDVTHQ
jgi:hypothetical protein